jgi:hypothetical protein
MKATLLGAVFLIVSMMMSAWENISYEIQLILTASKVKIGHPATKWPYLGDGRLYHTVFTSGCRIKNWSDVGIGHHLIGLAMGIPRQAFI